MNIEKELEMEDVNVNEVEENTDKKKVKRELAENRQNITIINEYIRFVTMSDGNRSLQKLHKYTDGSEDWVHDGWHGYKNDGSLFRNIIDMIRDSKLKQKEVSDLKYYIKCWEDAKKEVTEYFRVEF